MKIFDVLLENNHASKDIFICEENIVISILFSKRYSSIDIVRLERLKLINVIKIFMSLFTH